MFYTENRGKANDRAEFAFGNSNYGNYDLDESLSDGFFWPCYRFSFILFNCNLDAIPGTMAGCDVAGMYFLMLVMVFDYFTMSLLGTFSVDKAFMQEVVKADSDIRKFYLLFDKILLVVFSMLFRKYLQEYVIKKKYRFIIMAGIIGVFLVYITYNFKSIYAFMGWSIYVLICVAVAILLFFYRRWKDAEIAKAELQEKVRSYMQYYEEICQKQKENERTVHDVNYHLLNLLHLFEKEEYLKLSSIFRKAVGNFSAMFI